VTSQPDDPCPLECMDPAPDVSACSDSEDLLKFVELRSLEFDTGKEITAKGWEHPFRDYKYDKDARNMSRDEMKQIKQHFILGRKNRLKYR